ncbi:AMP-binding protein [candidate division WOR-3 bacterium]|nr:AMP-binding protein [candidate division WOR-3 bacterium]
MRQSITDPYKNINTIRDLFLCSVCRHESNTAYVHYKEYRIKEFSYGEIRRRVFRIAGYLDSLGYKKGDKIILCAENSPQWISLFFACSISGIIIVPLDHSMDENYILKISKLTQAKTVFCSRKKLFSLSRLKPLIIEYIFSLKGFSDFNPVLPVLPADILEIVFTSGTTSLPKGVMISNKNLASDVLSMIETVPFSASNTFLSMLPLSHLFEQNVGALIPFFLGCKVIFTHSIKPSVLQKALTEEKVTAMATVPAYMKIFKENIENRIQSDSQKKLFFSIMKIFDKLPRSMRKIIFRSITDKFGSLEWLLSGGAPLDESTEMFWDRLGVRVIQGYGITEASPIISCNRPGEKKIGSVGKALPDIKVKIITSGEILVRGDNVFSGYFNDPEKTRLSFEGAWFKTNDLGYFDQEGFLHITGRKNNVIVTQSGMNVFPEDLESIVNKENGVMESCVFGQISGGEQIITAVVVFAEGFSASLIGLKTSVNSKLMPHQTIQKMISMNYADIPRTYSMKIKRKELIEKVSEGGPPDPSPTAEDRFSEILSRLLSGNEGKITDETVLSETGMDSLRFLEFICALEQEFNLNIDEGSLKKGTTVKTLKDLIEAGNFEEKTGNGLLSRYRSRPARFIGLLLNLMSEFFLKFYFRIKIEGRKHIGNLNEPVIFVSNHLSHLDTPAIFYGIGYKLKMKTATAGAKDYFFDKKSGFLRKIFRIYSVLAYNIFPFSREGSVRDNLEYIGKLLDKNYSVILFPEGTRTSKVKKFKAGTGFFSVALEAPIVPVKIEGTDKVLPKGRLFPARGEIKVKFGKKMLFDRNIHYSEITKYVEKTIRNM